MKGRCQQRKMAATTSRLLLPNAAKHVIDNFDPNFLISTHVCLTFASVPTTRYDTYSQAGQCRIGNKQHHAGQQNCKLA